MEKDKNLLWLWLSLHFGANSKLYRDLTSYYDDIEDVYLTTDLDMNLIGWLSFYDKRKILNKSLEHAYEVAEWCSENDVQIISYSDPKYPSSLKALRRFPAVLYCKGELPDFDNELSVSLVGTRSMTDYGQKMAYTLGYTLSRSGAITVSGMARGIDSTVAIGSLNALGKTVAVLGCGIDIAYPRENAKLMNRIIENGAVITEYPPHTPPNSYNFPVRNRIISGISNATVIVEGSTDSGAMITARSAIEQGKTLFAIPGPARRHSSSGPNQLIKHNDAILARDATDILSPFATQFRDKIDFLKAKERPTFSKSAIQAEAGDVDKHKLFDKKLDLKAFLKRKTQSLEEIIEPAPEIKLDPNVYSEEQIKIYSVIERGIPTHVDDIVEKTGMSASIITSNLTLLQIDDLIEEISGGFFSKK